MAGIIRGTEKPLINKKNNYNRKINHIIEGKTRNLGRRVLSLFLAHRSGSATLSGI